MNWNSTHSTLGGVLGMKPLKRIAIVALALLSCVLYGGIGIGGDLNKPKELLARIHGADSCVIPSIVPLKVGSPQKLAHRAAASAEQSILIDDTAEISNILKTLHDIGLKRSSVCFCSGQPSLMFYKGNQLQGSLEVKHDDVIILRDADGNSGYFTGRTGLVDDFYKVIGPIIMEGERRIKDNKAAVPNSMPKAVLSTMEGEVGVEVKKQQNKVGEIPVPEIVAPTLSTGAKSN
jgi:hypothetical protein